MKYSTKLSDTVHVMVLIAINQEKSLSSASIAESVHTNPGFVRQLMLKLKKAGLESFLIHDQREENASDNFCSKISPTVTASSTLR